MYRTYIELKPSYLLKQLEKHWKKLNQLKILMQLKPVALEANQNVKIPDISDGNFKNVQEH